MQFSCGLELVNKYLSVFNNRLVGSLISIMLFLRFYFLFSFPDMYLSFLRIWVFQVVCHLH